MKNREITQQGRKEHLLVCLSPSPSNARIVEAASSMAAAFDAAFTALYVQPSSADAMSEQDGARLRKNIRLAQKNGATVATVVGDDTAAQIAEYARISGVTKIVIGQSRTYRPQFMNMTTLTEQLIATAPNVEIFIIPDSEDNIKRISSDIRPLSRIVPSWKDLLITALVILGATGIGTLFSGFGFSPPNIIPVYILAVQINSILAKSHLCSVLSSLLSVLVFNYFFIEPRYSFHAYETEYFVTFGIMLAASLITGTLANRLKDNAKAAARSAFRTQVLFDTNQLLQRTADEDEILEMAARQMIVMLNRDITIYPVREDKVGDGIFFYADKDAEQHKNEEECREAVDWVFDTGQRAGFSTDRFRSAAFLYLPIQIGGRIYGVVSVRAKEKPLEIFEYSLLLSILGECALALDNNRNAREKEQAAVMAQKEQLRANLLRTISHDLRTPLTSISGNASNLLMHYGVFDDSTRRQIFEDIYDDAQWLIGLVENLLSVTRLEDGQMKLTMSPQLLEEVIEEALQHIDRSSISHTIETAFEDELLLAEMDARLIVQVLINLVNNALKYTPAGSRILVRAKKKGSFVQVRVEDNGPGLSKEDQQHIFDMFYTGQSSAADGKRSLGLGLALCKSIVEAHGGEIRVEDNVPTGCVFSFTLPAGEVMINE